MTSNKEIVKRVETRNRKTTNKNIRIANAIEGIYDLAVHIEGHVRSMGVLECVKNIENYHPSTAEMEEITNAVWMIAQDSTDSFEEAIGVITCAQIELHSDFSRLNQNGGGVEMDGFIKNKN